MSARLPDDDLVIELLAWLGDRGRPYAEVMARWRTSCPRLAIWEDAVAMRLVRSLGRGSPAGERVVLTGEGRRVLAGRALGSRRGAAPGPARADRVRERASRPRGPRR